MGPVRVWTGGRDPHARLSRTPGPGSAARAAAGAGRADDGRAEGFGVKWLPWRRIVRHVARSHGFLDPFALLARVQQFGQPSEVHHPIELLRAGVAMHARGLLNARIIQHNLDWIWPYWVQRQ